MEAVLDVVHYPDAWLRSHEKAVVETVTGPFAPRVIFVHGPMGVALVDVEGEAWWLVFWRDSGRLFAALEDLHLAQVFADTLMRVPFLDEMLAGLPNPSGKLAPWISSLRSAVRAMSAAGGEATDPRTNGPALIGTAAGQCM